jgi:hypothetical protein
MPADPLRDAVRRMLVPISPGMEREAVDAVRGRLDALGIVGDDQPEYVRQLTEEWRSTQRALQGPLRDLVRRATRSGFPVAHTRFANNYGACHEALQRQHVLRFEDATSLLSYAPAMRDLAVGHRMSSSAIARVLEGHGFRAEVPWRAVHTVLSSMRVAPALTVGNPGEPGTIQGLLAADITEADSRFLDADIAAGAEMVGAAATELGFHGDLTELLLQLCDADGTTFVPYLQVLHFQSTVAAFYDHPVTMPYEFRPRGKNADFLGTTYQALTNTLSAFLNNMKAIERLDTAWARGRDQERARAHSLVALLEGMERTAFHPRIELAAWLRQWLLRVIALAPPPANPVPAVATDVTVANVLTDLAGMAGGSNTGGVIEQRVVDALASALHRDPEGWRPRGLGFPVNASNLSSRRLGDCDFQRPPAGAHPPEVVAYEATAGRLTRTYLAGHLQTLRRCIAARATELDGVADRGQWRVRIVFVAHDFAPDLPAAGALPAPDYAGVSIETDYVTYADLAAAVNPALLADAFTEHVHARLNEARTPRAAREKFLTLLP